MYSFLAIEVLVLPAFIEKELYSIFEYYKFIIFSSPFLMFGVSSGFLYCNYSLKSNYFNELVIFGTIYALIVVVPIAWVYFGNILFVVLCFLMVLSVFVEQKLQTQKMFILALGLKPLISIFLVISVAIFYFSGYDGKTINTLFFSMVLAFLLWLLIAYNKLELYKSNNVDIKKYFIMLKKGFPINAGTILIMLFFFCDRFIAKEYYSADLATYSLAYNLIQFIILALSTLAYTNVVDIGERRHDVNFVFLKNKLLYNYKIFLILLFLFAFFIFGVSSIYNFDNMVCYSLVMAILLGNYFTINTISSIALYLDFFKKIVWVMFFLFLFNAMLSFLFIKFELEYIYFLIKTGVLLNFSALYFMWLLIGILKNENK